MKRFHGEPIKHPDENDQAAAVDLFLTDIGIHQAKMNAARINVFNDTGTCLNCGFELEGSRRFCDQECADEWEKYNG